MALARCGLELTLILLALISVWANDAGELDMAAELDMTAELIGRRGGRTIRTSGGGFRVSSANR